MPDVTVDDSPSGAPSTITGCPTRKPADLPSGIAGSFDSLTLITAISVSASLPTSVAGTRFPSLNSTDMVPPSAARATTWLLVKM